MVLLLLISMTPQPDKVELNVITAALELPAAVLSALHEVTAVVDALPPPVVPAKNYCEHTRYW